MLDFLDEEDRFRGRIGKSKPQSASSQRRSSGRGKPGSHSSGGGGRGQTRPQAFQRAVVKIHSTRLAQTGLSRAKSHAKYLEREGVGKDDEPAKAFGKDDKDVELSDFIERCADDRHMFRVILSPEFGEDLDLEAYTKDVMKQAEVDLRTKLEWAAVCHYNTDNPHAHIIVRGVDDRGDDLVIARDYLTRGLRERANEVATYNLGPRTTKQIKQAQIRDLSAKRFTQLDRKLLEYAKPMEPKAPGTKANPSFTQNHESTRLVDLRVNIAHLKPDALRSRNQLLKRASALESMGVARPVAKNRWEIPADLEGYLKDMARQGDIIRRMYAAKRTDPARWAESSQQNTIIMGRLVNRGLSDDHKGHEYLIVEAADGLAHHIENAEDADKSLRPNVQDIVSVKSIEGKKPVVTRLADPDLKASIDYDGPVWLDRYLAEDKYPSAATGFAKELNQAMKARRRALEGMRVVAPGESIPPQILKTMRARERSAYVHKYAQKAGKSAVSLNAGEHLRGKISPAIQLNGGVYHRVESSTRVALLPSDKTLRKHAGTEARVSYKVNKDGRMRAHVKPVEHNKGLER